MIDGGPVVGRHHLMGENYVCESYRTARPDKVQAIGIMNVVDGVLNLIWSPILAFTFGVGVATPGIGCLVLPSPPFPWSRASSACLAASACCRTTTRRPARRPAWPSQIANVLSGNVISLGIGIAALVLYNDPEVRDYFSSKPV